MALLPEIHIHVHYHDGNILSELHNLKQLIMTTNEQWDALLTRLQATVTNIADDIRRLAEQGSGGGLNEAQQDAIFAKFMDFADQLDTVAAITPETPPTT